MRAWRFIIVALVLTGCAGARMNGFVEPPDPLVDDLGDNLFLKAKATASGSWKSQKPALAVDGNRSLNRHWACENLPVWHMVELAEPSILETIQLWLWWYDRRSYQFHIEGSVSGEEWHTLVDQRENDKPATAEGLLFSFDPTRVKYVRTTITGNSAGEKSGGHIVEIEGYAPQSAAARARQRANRAVLKDKVWAAVGPGLSGAVGSIDVRYGRSAVPATDGATTWVASAWRGERVNGQFVLWTKSGVESVTVAASALHNDAGERIPASSVKPHFVRYVRGDGQLLGDVLEPAGKMVLPSYSTRPVWVYVDVPAETNPGIYRGSLTVRGAGIPAMTFGLEIDVLGTVLPPPDKWSFHLDLWQNPWAVARYHGVKPWSEAHFKLLKPVLEMLALAGQKCLTATIVHHAWGAQTYDPMPSMVEWRRLRNGAWTFDFSLFDRYVTFAAECGYTGAINCYSLVPWAGIHYYDENEKEYQLIAVDPSADQYRSAVGAFLRRFAAHLKSKRWFARVRIALDERPPETMLAVMALVAEHAPGLDTALAGGDHPELYESVDDYCFFITHRLAPEVIRKRVERGMPTTFYVCCGPMRPNNFPHSPPAESAWMGWFAAARGYTGFLRWAANSWTRDPFYDTSYPKHPDWPAGDCFLIYPGPRTSIRFERLREGIQDYEKIRIVRAGLSKLGTRGRSYSKDLDAALAKFDYPDIGSPEELTENVNAAKYLLNALARLLY